MAVATVPLTGCDGESPSSSPRSAASDSSDPILKKVAGVISETLGKPARTITTEKNLVKDLGADSLDAVEIVMALEEEFHLTIDDAAAEKMQTVGDFVDYIRSHRKL